MKTSNRLLSACLALGIPLGCDGGGGGETDTDIGGGSSTGGASSAGSDTTGSGPETGNGSSPGSGSGTPGSSGSTTGAPPADPGAPQIISFSTNVTEITQGESVIFTAIVTDPDGIDDVIGGTLENSEGSVFGSFTTTAQEGAYSLTLSWAAVDQVSAIEFEYGATASRLFTARFFDQSAGENTAQVEIEFTCAGVAACDGQCIDTMASSNNCGACGTICEGQECCDGVCTSTDEDPQNCGSCGNDCGEDNCESGYCYEDYDTGYAFEELDDDTVFESEEFANRPISGRWHSLGLSAGDPEQDDVDTQAWNLGASQRKK